MARKIEPQKAKDEIQRYFNHLDLNDKLDLLTILVKSMIKPTHDKEKLEILKKELQLYKSAAGTVVKDYVNSEMKKIEK